MGLPLFKNKNELCGQRGVLVIELARNMWDTKQIQT